MYNTDIPNRADLPTTRQLVRSTLIAIGVAAVLLVTVVLPAEYAIDPTGIGKVLGLTEMGEIKQQLAEEAEADEATTAVLQETLDNTVVPDGARAIVAEVEAAPTEPAPTAPSWQDEVSVTLAPGEAAEIKLIMKAGETATYQWSVDQGHLNSDLHADGTAGEFISYRKGRAETGDAGELAASFDGTHGWYWRNRSDVPSTVTLQTKGAYTELKRVL
jgi:hypothetical protein